MALGSVAAIPEAGAEVALTEAGVVLTGVGAAATVEGGAGVAVA